MFDQQISAIDENTITNLKQSGLSSDILEQIENHRSLNNASDDEVHGLIRLINKTCQINEILMLDPKDHLIDLVERTDHLSLKDEQQKDETIKRVISWQTRERVEDLTYASFQLKKYGKQFNRLVLQNRVLFRKFFDDTGKIKTLQFCLPKHLWREVVYRLHNSKLAGHVGKNSARVQKKILLSWLHRIFDHDDKKLSYMYSNKSNFKQST